MNTEDEILQPAMRRWILSEAVPHVWAAAFVANLDNGQELALRIADAAAAAVEQIKRAPPKPLESIAAQSGLAIDEQDFRGWYRVCHGLRRGRAVEYTLPSDREVEVAYEAYRCGMGDFY
ncbi:hypothetical protein [Stenotrophomonas rhizophila]|uniref:hypothetical protein n=1 Tax=Stenotrophomonas rhizophila TaxID=216778 RepID=UPI00112F4758|nr:hypothetical protein [Stenotrophomonas rhizophila]